MSHNTIGNIFILFFISYFLNSITLFEKVYNLILFTSNFCCLRILHNIIIYNNCSILNSIRYSYTINNIVCIFESNIFSK